MNNSWKIKIQDQVEVGIFSTATSLQRCLNLMKPAEFNFVNVKHENLIRGGAGRWNSDACGD